MDFHNIWSILFRLLPIIYAVLFIWFWRKFLPPTYQVNKLQFVLIFYSSLFIPSFFPMWPVMLLVVMFGTIPALLTGLISLLLRLYVFKKNQIPWFISTVIVGFVIAMMKSFFIGSQIKVAIFFGICGAICSFCSALVLTVFPKSKQENNE